MPQDPPIRPAALDTKGAARYLGVAPKSMANWRAPSSTSDGPPWRRIGAKPVYLVADLDKWLAARPRRYRTRVPSGAEVRT